MLYTTALILHYHRRTITEQEARIGSNARPGAFRRSVEATGFRGDGRLRRAPRRRRRRPQTRRFELFSNTFLFYNHARVRTRVRVRGARARPERQDARGSANAAP